MIEFNATFIVAMLSFVVFIFIMNAIFYRPILNIMKKRNDYIGKNLEDTENFKKAAEQNKQIHADKIEEKQNECRNKFKKSIENAQNEANEKIKDARENSKLTIQQNKDKLTEEEKNLQSIVEKTVINNLASEITKKITQGVLN